MEHNQSSNGTSSGGTNDDPDLGFDLEITKVSRRGVDAGKWVCGTLSGHRFEALVFPEHAENPAYEIGDSRISKLWVQRLADKRQVYNWDRGLDQDAADATAQAIVAFLCEGLAEFVFER